METRAASLISTEELAKILDNENVKVLDCSVGLNRDDDHRINFLKTHIKGA